MSKSIYASGTTVSVEKSETELKSILRRYDAEAIMMGEHRIERRAQCNIERFLSLLAIRGLKVE